MKVLYSAIATKKAIPITGGDGLQFLILWLERDNNWYVYYSDEYESKVYLNKIINKGASGGAAGLFNGDNFKRIDDDEEYESIMKWIDNNYNYSGIHIDEKRNQIQGIDSLTTAERMIVDQIKGKK